MSMDGKPTQPRTLTLQEVLEGAERAEQRVSNWPQWKRELSAELASPQARNDDAKR